MVQGGAQHVPQRRSGALHQPAAVRHYAAEHVAALLEVFAGRGGLALEPQLIAQQQSGGKIGATRHVADDVRPPTDPFDAFRSTDLTMSVAHASSAT